jgi:hypothetical protein
MIFSHSIWIIPYFLFIVFFSNLLRSLSLYFHLIEVEHSFFLNGRVNRLEMRVKEIQIGNGELILLFFFEYENYILLKNLHSSLLQLCS